MKTSAAAIYHINGWDEKPLHEFPTSHKITIASVRKSYKGDMEAHGTLEYLMTYLPDGSAAFVGLEQVSGQVGGRAGSFILQHSGTFAAGVLASSCSVVPGSGTDGLSGLTGNIEFGPEQPEKVFPLTFRYELSAAE